MQKFAVPRTTLEPTDLVVTDEDCRIHGRERPSDDTGETGGRRPTEERRERGRGRLLSHERASVLC